MLVCAKRAIDPARDIRSQLETIPFVHFDSELPLGRLINQHLRRLNLSLKTRYTFDATRSLLAVTRDIGGWALGTPLCMMDSVRFRDSLDLHQLPFSGFTRTVSVVARRGEFSDLPQHIANICSKLISVHILPELTNLAPFAAPKFILHIEADANETDFSNPIPREVAE